MKKYWNFLSSLINPVKRVPPVVLFCFFAGFLFFSCSGSGKSSSFAVALNTIDSYISLGQNEDALKLLKKTSKSAYSAYSRLGIYRRYMTLGEKSLAEKTLLSAMKKIPGNLEIIAVYGNFLLKENRIPEALKIASALKGTEYGSIYGEILLKSPQKGAVFSMKQAEIYRDCYSATKNERWLVNAALLFLENGNYSEAAVLQQNFDSEFCLFWAAVQFDARNYDLCLENLENAEKRGDSGFDPALASDAFYMLGDYDSAEKQRESIILKAESEKTSDVPENVYLNSAIWAYNTGDFVRAYDLLMTVVMRNSKNIPALLTYGKFARGDFEVEAEDLLEQELRKTVLRTYSMQQRDERPKFLVADAAFRIDQVLQWQKENSLPLSQELLVEKLSLWLTENSSLPQKKLESEIWKTLENNEIAENMYPPLLVHFAVSRFLNFGKTEEARLLFEKYLDARYKMKPQEQMGNRVEYDIFGGEKRYSAPVVPDFVTRAAFGERAADYARTMENWEIETAAFFALLDGNASAARRLYEYVLFETGGAKTVQADGQIVSFSRLCSVTSAVNLAGLYSADGDMKKALNLYGLASGRAKSRKLKSKILYLTALVQEDLKNTDGAVLSLEYALSLDPMNAQARLLLKKLK